MANKIRGRFWKLLSLLVAVAIMLGALPSGASAAPWDDDDRDGGNWSYAYYLGQEYLGNAGGDPVKPDPVGYGFQGVITELTFKDDAGKSWTFVWSAEANGEWRITGQGVSEAVAKAWPQVTNGRRYIGYCNGTAYTFTLSQEGSAESWTYARDNHANWFYYIRFIREYTVNVFYQNETGTVTYNGVTYAAQKPLVREFNFLYPNGNIIDDSEYEDGEYTDPITLLPADYLTQDLIDQGYELKYATDGSGNDVLRTGVTISLLGDNVLNVYCTLIPPETENYNVIHKYYTGGALDGSQDGGTIEVVEGADFAQVVDGIDKLTVYSENTYEYTSYQVHPESKTIELTYVRTVEPEPTEPEPTEPEPTEPEPTEPEPTEPEPTEPEPTEPEPTEPEPTEPEPTEPEPTEPEPTEPEPTEPEPTEPEPTEPEPTEPEPTEPEPTEPEPTEPGPEPAPQSDEPPATEPAPQSDEPPATEPAPQSDEPPATEPPADTPVPTAEVPKTGGSLYMWIMLSVISGTGLAGLAMTRKKED